MLTPSPTTFVTDVKPTPIYVAEKMSEFLRLIFAEFSTFIPQPGQSWILTPSM